MGIPPCAWSAGGGGSLPGGGHAVVSRPGIITGVVAGVITGIITGVVAGVVAAMTVAANAGGGNDRRADEGFEDEGIEDEGIEDEGMPCDAAEAASRRS